MLSHPVLVIVLDLLASAHVCFRALVLFKSHAVQPLSIACPRFEQRDQNAVCLSVFEWNLHSLNCGDSCLSHTNISPLFS